MRIVLIEDDALIGEGVRMGLKDAGYAVDWVKDGMAAETALTNHQYDAAILDLALPRKHGLAVLRSLRTSGADLPVIILTAADAHEQRVAGLDAGADDYLLKPFHLPELLARLRALLRRAQGRAITTVTQGDLEVNPDSKQVLLAGKNVTLSAKEFAVLYTLIASPNRPVAKNRLEEALYGWGEEIQSNALEVHIHHLRKKLGAQRIQTLRGIGYVLLEVSS
ncbi:MAG: response regulator [Gallionella sp.]|nr:response regulator [Gallionella sp.]